MGTFGKVVGGIGVLIAMYLLIKNADQTVKVIQTISANSIAGIATLQGR